MTIYNKTSLKLFFETGDVPNGTNFADFIDSCVNMAETGVQAMAGAINPTEVITARVSAGTGIFTGNVSIDGTLSAANFSINALNAVTISAGSINSIGNITASAASVYASAIRSSDGLYASTTIISAAGSTQATAALLTAVINNGAGVVDGQTTGFILPANRTGWEQKIINGTASANLWPCVGGQINALASNAAFGMTANTLYTIVHTRASGYAVK
jgi:hypothetical protein